MGVAASRSNAAIRYERKAPHVGPQHAPVLEYPAVGPVTGVADRHDSLQADFVIIGGGTAGCVLADRLSACGRHRVLLIEAGGADRSPWIHIPLGYGKLFDHPRLDWRFATVPQAGLDGRSIGVPRGKVLGGCSSTNGLRSERTTSELQSQ